MRERIESVNGVQERLRVWIARLEEGEDSA